MIPQTPQIAMSAKKENDVMGLCLRERRRHSIFFCLALVTMFSMFLLTTVNVQANTVTIIDQARVLDAGQVQVEAAQLPDPILIYAIDWFTGDQDALNTYTRDLLPNQNAIAICIDTVHRNLSIEAGTNVSLSNREASDAVSAIRSNYDNGGDNTSATLYALYSMQYNLFNNPADTFAMVTLGILLFIIGIVVVGLVVVSTRKGGGSAGRPRGSFWGGSYGSGSSGGGAGGHF